MSISDSNYSHPTQYLESPTHKPPFPQTEDQIVSKNVRRKILERQSNRLFPVNNWFISVMEDRLVRWRPSVSSTLIEDAIQGKHPYQASCIDTSIPSNSHIIHQSQQVDVPPIIKENVAPAKNSNKKSKNKKTKKQLEEESQLQILVEQEAARLAQLEKERLETEERIKRNRLDFVHGETTVRLLKELDKFYSNYKHTLNNSNSFLIKNIPGFDEEQDQEQEQKTQVTQKSDKRTDEFVASPLNIERDLEKCKKPDVQVVGNNSIRPEFNQNINANEDENFGWCCY